MNKIKEIMKWFVYITPCVLLMCAVIYSINKSENITVLTLWQILLSSAATACITVFFPIKKKKKKSQFLATCIAHYISLCIIMSAFGIWFGWTKISFLSIAIMCTAVGIVYLAVFGITYSMKKQEAAEINEVLRRRFSNNADEVDNG